MTTQQLNTEGQKMGSAGWGWVLLGGLFEVGFTYALKMEQQNKAYMALFIVCAVLSFECLSQSLKTLPVSLAYAVWTGIGSVGAVIVGLFAFGDTLSPLRLALMAVLIGAILGLKLVDGRSKEQAQ